MEAKPKCRHPFCDKPSTCHSWLGKFTNQHNKSFCSSCRKLNDNFCWECGLPACCAGDQLPPGCFEEFSRYCKKCQPTRLCETWHVCQASHCSTRFCERNFKTDVNYIKGLTKEQKALFKTKEKNFCLPCLMKLKQYKGQVEKARLMVSDDIWAKQLNPILFDPDFPQQLN